MTPPDLSAVKSPLPNPESRAPQTPIRTHDQLPFLAPWQARLHGCVQALIASGRLDPAHWAKHLGGELARLPAAATPDEVWACQLRALETWMVSSGAARPLQLVALRQAWQLAAETTPHGRAIQPSAALRRWVQVER